MALTIPSVLLSATTSDQTHTFSGSWLAAIFFNADATNAVQIEFDSAVGSGSCYIPAGETRSFNIGIYAQNGKQIVKPLDVHYKAVSGTASIYLTYITE